jgi:hypothetical protein
MRDGRFHQCQRAARWGFRTCGFHGAGFAKRERAGAKKNPATVQLRTGRYAKLEMLAILARSDLNALDAYVTRSFQLQIDALADRLGVGRREQSRK